MSAKGLAPRRATLLLASMALLYALVTASMTPTWGNAGALYGSFVNDHPHSPRARANFVSGMILDSLAPTNTLLGNPSAIKKSVETGGASLLRGLKNAYNDMVHNDGIVSQVDSRPFKIGKNIATSPGAVIYRSEIMELIQYAPTTEAVHEFPLLIIPPQINKAYINDLTPEKSIIRYELAHGIQPFLISWRNPQIEHRDWGLAEYVEAIITALDVVTSVTGAKKVNVAGACSGGITTATLLSRLKAMGDERINSATLMVCVLHPQRNDSEAGALVSEHGIKLARERSAKKGILEGSSLARTFAWLRPNDLVLVKGSRGSRMDVVVEAIEGAK